MEKMENHSFRMTINNLCVAFVHAFYRMKVVRAPEFPEGPALIVANHRHYFDVIAVHTSVRRLTRRWVYWVAKKELFGIRVFGAAVVKLGAIPVDREKVDLVAARGIFGHLRQGELVGIFPQGTRVPESELADRLPHAGAAHFAIKTGVPIVPVWVDPFRLFRTVRVIYGSPFRLEADARTHYSHEQLQSFSCEIMQRIFALAGQDYPCTISVPMPAVALEPAGRRAEQQP